MEYPCITFFLFLANLLFLGGTNKISHDFQECLSLNLELLNSTNNLIYSPQHSKFASVLKPNNLRPLSTSRVSPDLIVTPYHESHILAAVYCSKKLGVQIRVRSGGHDYEGLSYTSENPFVVVDMRNFQSISIDVEEKTARVQVGATLGQFYYTISQKSKTLAFPAGVCPHVGVGGHFSGGGYGMISRKHGIAVDHIIDAKLINADGQILDRRSMGEDLFWAIRGGGAASFGIIVEYKVSLVTVPETVTVFNVTKTSETATQLVYRWQYIADKVDENILLRLFLSSVRSSSGNRTISASFATLYLGSVTNLLSLMKDQFPELGLVKEDCIEMSWVESTLFFPGLRDKPLNVLLDRTQRGIYTSKYFKGKSDFVSRPIPMNGLREIWRFLSEVDNGKLQFSPYGGALNTFPEFETPFPHRKGNIFMIHYSAGWANPNESEKHIDWIRRLYSFMSRYVTKSPRTAYFNYRDLDIGRNNVFGSTSYEQASVWGLKYFKSNFRRLVRVKSVVDPSNFFRNEQSIPSLSSNLWEANCSFSPMKILAHEISPFINHGMCEDTIPN